MFHARPMIRLFFPPIVAVILLVLWISIALGIPVDVVDCGTSDVPGCVTLTFADGSQQARPSILPTLTSTLENLESTDTTPCSGLVAEPILFRPDPDSAWSPVVEKTYCACGAFDYVAGKCKRLNCK